MSRLKRFLAPQLADRLVVLVDPQVDQGILLRPMDQQRGRMLPAMLAARVAALLPGALLELLDEGFPAAEHRL